MRVETTLFQLKEERTLVSHFVITARTSPEIALEESIGNYESSIVPKSLFSDDGQPLLSTDKAKVLHEIESLVKEYPHDDVENIDQDTARIIIIDGMALVNRVHKNSNNKEWKVYLHNCCFFRIVNKHVFFLCFSNTFAFSYRYCM